MRTAVLSALTAVLTTTLVAVTAAPASAVAYPDGEYAPGQERHVVAVFYQESPGDDAEPRQMCTGTVLAPQMVLTAAHCVDDVTSEQLSVTAHAGTRLDGFIDLIGVTGFVQHPRYLSRDGVYGVNDVAVLRLASPIDGTPAVLPTSEKQALGLIGKAKLTTVGYGIDQNGKDAVALRWARQNDYSNVARKFYKAFTKRTQIAAGRLHKAEKLFSGGTCSGDSGGPLLGKVGSKVYVLGVTSFGAEDCAAALPGFYMRTGYYSKWVRESLSTLVNTVGTAYMTYAVSDSTYDAEGASGYSLELSGARVESRPGLLSTSVFTPSNPSARVEVGFDYDRDGTIDAFTRNGQVLSRDGAAVLCAASTTRVDNVTRVDVQSGCLQSPSRLMNVVAYSMLDADQSWDAAPAFRVTVL